MSGGGGGVPVKGVNPNANQGSPLVGVANPAQPGVSQANAFTITRYAIAGVAVGVALTTVVLVGAPILVSLGFSQAAVTTGLLIGGGIGAWTTSIDIYQNWKAGNWNMVAYDFGQLFGGFLIGAGGGGRWSAEGIMKGPSKAPNTYNIFEIIWWDITHGYTPSQGLNPGPYMKTGPTPLQSGTTATGIGAAPVTSISIAEWIYKYITDQK